MSIIDGSGRFLLLEKPMAFPFKDIVLSTPEGPVFDLSVDLNYYSGVAYLKASHVEEMAHTLGMITKEEAEELRAKIAHLESVQDTLPDHVESLLHGINDSILHYANARSVAGISIPVYLQDPDPGTADRKGIVDEPDSTDSGKSVTIESDKSAGKDSSNAVGKRSDELSGDSGDGFGF